MTHPLSRTLCHPQSGQQFTVGKETYELAAQIGDGAVGIVRKARKLRDDSLQAIKFLAPDPKYIDESSFDDVAARFKREGERGSRLDNPYLIRVHKYVPNDEGAAFLGELTNPFLIMDCVAGRTLESYIRRLPKQNPSQATIDGDLRDLLTVDITVEKLDLALQIVQAVEYLHKKKLVHRDIKPANIFICKSDKAPGRFLLETVSEPDLA